MDIEEEEGTQTPKLVIDEGTKRGTDSPERPTTSNEEPMGRVEEESNLSVKTCGTELMSETGSSALACGGEPSPSSTSSFELHEETSERGSIMDPKDPPEGASEDKQEASTSAETKEISEPELNKESPKFDWKTYLAETESDPAPRCNFYQTMGPIQNNLKEDMKIECQDPRGPTGKFCLTNVEAVHSVFACVRLMGCDSSNDRWLLCNDRNIQYIGYTRDQGKGDLEPPVGYMYNMAKFRTFLDAQLQDGEPATRDVIDSIPLDVLPKKNMFEVGQKLEAIDPQNFMGTVHPATVLDVNGKTVKIAFDGWPKGYDMVCSFDSRYIFPIGWADSVQMKLEPPPKPKKKRKIEVKTEAKDEQQTPVPPKKKKSAVSSKSKGKDRRSKSSTPKVTLKEEPKKSQTKSTKTKKKESIKKEPCDTPDPTPEKALPKRSKSKKPHENLTKEEEFDNSSPVVKLSQSTLDQLLVPITDFNSKSKTFSSPDRKPTASPRKSETPAPTIFEKLKASGSFQSSRSTTPEDPPKPVAEGTKMAVDSTPKVSRPFARKSLGPPAGKSTSGSSVSSTAKSKKQPVKQDPTPPKPTLPHLEKIVVHVKQNCNAGPLLESRLLRTYEPLSFGPHPPDVVMKETLQHLVNCSKFQLRETVLNAIPKGSSRQTVSAEYNGNLQGVNLVELKSHSQAWGLLKDFLSRIGACRNLLGPTNDQQCSKCTKSGSTPKSEIPSSYAASTSGSAEKAKAKNPEHWSVEEVARFVSDLEETELPDLFRQSSIDGRAMFLLTPDLCMRYMNLRLGPALKVCAKIDTLKAAHAGEG